MQAPFQNDALPIALDGIMVKSMTNPYLQYLYEGNQLNETRWALYVDTLRKKRAPQAPTEFNLNTLEPNLWRGIDHHLEVLVRVAQEKEVTELVDLYYGKYIAHELKPPLLDVAVCRSKWLYAVQQSPALEAQWKKALYQTLSNPNVNLHLWADISPNVPLQELPWETMYPEAWAEEELSDRWKPRPEYESSWLDAFKSTPHPDLLVAYLAFQLQPAHNSKRARKYQLHRLEEFYQQYGKALVHQALDNNEHPELHHHLGHIIEQCSDAVALASYEWLLHPKRMSTFKDENWPRMWLTRLSKPCLEVFDERLDEGVQQYASDKQQATYATLMLSQRDPRSIEQGLGKPLNQLPCAYWPDRNDVTAAQVTTRQKMLSPGEFAVSLIQRVNQLYQQNTPKVLAHDLNYLCMLVTRVEASPEQQQASKRMNAPLLLALSAIDATIRHESLVTSIVKMQWLRQFNQEQMVSLNNPMVELLEKYYPEHQAALTSLRFQFIDWYSEVPNHHPQTLEGQNKTLMKLWDGIASVFNIPYLHYEELTSTATLMNVSHYQLLCSALLPTMPPPEDTKELWDDLAVAPNSML